MAYPYINPMTYAPNYYTTPYSAPTPAQNVTPNVVTPPPQTAPTGANNGLVWVQGETGAKSYLVTPNTNVLLMDSESQRFFIKSADSSGMPLPLRTFEYKEITALSAESESPVKHDIDLGNYVTREEFDRRIAELTPKKGGKKSEVKDDE